MTIHDKRRMHCSDCHGELFYFRNPATRKLAAFHHKQTIPANVRLLEVGNLPHTKRTLDRVRNGARCGKVEGASSSS